MFVCSYGAKKPLKHTRKEHTTMKESTLLSIFGAKVSNDGKKLVLTLVSGEDDNKQFYNTCIKLDNSQKTRVKVDEEKQVAYLEVKLLKPKKEEDDVDEISDEDLPF